MSAEQRDALTEQFDKASRVAAAEPIAVVGIGCRFPGGVSGPAGLLELPRRAAPTRSARSPRTAGRPTSSTTRTSSRRAGCRPSGAASWTTSPVSTPTSSGSRRARPRRWIPSSGCMLEVACEALEHAGIGTDEVAGVRAAVMMGVYYAEYQTISAANPDTIDAYSATGNAHSRRRRAHRLPARAARPRSGGGHGVLVVAGDDPPGLPEPALARERPRAGRRRQPDPAPGNPDRDGQVGHAVAARPLPLPSTRAPTASSAARAAAWSCSSG